MLSFYFSFSFEGQRSLIFLKSSISIFLCFLGPMVSYLRNLCLIRSHKGLYLYFLLDFYSFSCSIWVFDPLLMNCNWKTCCVWLHPFRFIEAFSMALHTVYPGKCLLCILQSISGVSILSLSAGSASFTVWWKSLSCSYV